MPVYNGEKYLRQAIESILNQTFTDFEFLIIDDGSSDRSLDIINQYSDPRIQLVVNNANLGLIATLNNGIDLARGHYIARMDCDDISLPERLSKQISIFDTYPSVGVCGTWAQKINSHGRIIDKFCSPTGHNLHSFFWRPSPIIHPTAVVRASLLKSEKYNISYQSAEDYELWLRLSKKTQFFNISEPLLLYRVHSSNTTNRFREEQLLNSYRAFCSFYNFSGISYEMFLGLISAKVTTSPFQRAYILFKLLQNFEFDTKSFLIDNFMYFKFWVKSCVS